MNTTLPLMRRVSNDNDESVIVIPRKQHAELEVGTDTAYVRIQLHDMNALRAIAGHLMAVADEVARRQQGTGV